MSVHSHFLYLGRYLFFIWFVVVQWVSDCSRSHSNNWQSWDLNPCPSAVHWAYFRYLVGFYVPGKQ